MKKLIVALGLVLGFVFSSFNAWGAGKVKIRWFGHSCFFITTSKGTKILIDPFSPDVGYPIPKVEPDLVIISHEHYDHNYAQMARGNPKIIHCLDVRTKDWRTINEQFKDVHIYTVPTYHDEAKGALRGKNSVIVLELGGLRIVHLGDLGHLLSPEQVKKIGKVDVLMIPVGGVYTIDAQKAKQVIKQLNPKLIFPMHYKTSACKLPINTIDAFLKGEERVKNLAKPSYVIDKLPEKSEIILLSWK